MLNPPSRILYYVAVISKAVYQARDNVVLKQMECNTEML